MLAADYKYLLVKSTSISLQQPKTLNTPHFLSTEVTIHIFFSAYWLLQNYMCLASVSSCQLQTAYLFLVIFLYYIYINYCKLLLTYY